MNMYKASKKKKNVSKGKIGMYKAIIFDIGGVIVIEPHDSWKGILDEVGRAFGIDPSVLVSGFKENEAPIQKGEMTLLCFYKNMAEKLGRKDLDAQQLLDKHLEVYSINNLYDKEMLKLIESLKEKFVVACLSNMEPEMVEYHRRKGLMERFAKCFISTEMGVRKPDTNIYQKAVEGLGIQAREAVFIENNKEYVDVANRMGIKGVLFEGLEKLKADLGSLGVLREKGNY